MPERADAVAAETSPPPSAAAAAGVGPLMGEPPPGRVIEPDLLWVQSVTDRLMGSPRGLTAAAGWECDQAAGGDAGGCAPAGLRPTEQADPAAPEPPPHKIAWARDAADIPDLAPDHPRIGQRPGAAEGAGAGESAAPPGGAPPQPGGPAPATPRGEEAPPRSGGSGARHAAPARSPSTQDLASQAVRAGLACTDPQLAGLLLMVAGRLVEASDQLDRLTGWLGVVLEETAPTTPWVPLLREFLAALGTPPRR